MVNQNEIIRVSTKNGDVVILSEREYNGLMGTLHVYSISGIKEYLIGGLNTELGNCVE